MAKLLTGTRIYGTGTVDTQLFVSGTNSATSTTTGALQVVGGVGVGGNLHVGGTIFGGIISGTASTATNADNVKTVLQTANASYYPAFVDSNNSTAAYEALYTTSSFVINPQSGNIGIGVIPATKLHVYGSGGTTLRLQTASTSSGNFIDFYTPTSVRQGYIGTVDTSGQFFIHNDLPTALIFDTNNTERLRITGTGSVGIGTNSPSYPLHLLTTSTTSAAFRNSASTTTQILIGNTAGDTTIRTAGSGDSFIFSDTSKYLAFGTGATERLRITANGGISFGGSGTAYGVSGQILQSNGDAAPTWISTGSLAAANATTATHLSGGVAGQVPYQTAPGVTAFLSTGTAGNVLVSNGSSAPTYNNTLTLTGTTAATSTTTGALQVVGGVGVGGDLFIRGDILTNDTTFNLINANATTVNFAGAATTLAMGASGSGTTNVRNNLTVSGNLTVQGTTTIVDSTVTNIADPIITLGGGTGNSAPTADDNKDRGIAFKWVSNAGTTSTGFFGYDDSTGYLTYVPTATITNEVVSGTKGAMDVNLAGGTAMSIVYQSAADTTAFLAATTSGYILQTNGTGSPPTWVSASGVSAGSATYADQIRTIAQTASASYYPTFVDSNNASNAYELVYTTSSFVINPQSGNIGIGVSSPAQLVDAYKTANADVAIQVSNNNAGTSATAQFFASNGSTKTQFFHTGESYSGVGVLASAPGLGGIYNTTAQGLALISAHASGVIKFATGSSNTERVRIDSNGILLVGGTTAYSSAKLQLINGDNNTGSLGIAQMAFQYTSASGGGYAHYIQSRHDSAGAVDGNALVFNLNTGTTVGASSAFGTGNALSYYMGYLTHRWNTSGTERLRITALGGISFGASGTAVGSSGQILQSNADAPPTWVNASSIGAGSVSTVAQTANASYFPTFVDSNNASVAAESLYTTSSFVVNPQSGNVGIGTASPSTKLHVYESGAADVALRLTPANGSYDALFQMTGQANAIATEGFEIWYANNVGDVRIATTFADDAAAIRFHTRTGASKSTSNERLTIAGNGNVGIGITSPTYKLDITGTLRYQSVSAGANTVVWGTGRASDYHYHQYYASPGASDGYTLFGHYAFSSLVSSNTQVANYQFAKEGSSSDNKTYFNLATHNGTSLAERLRITSNGGIAFGGSTNYGTSGQLLRSNGDAAPTWINQSNITVGTSTQVTTVAQTASASYFPTFVDSNNASATAESLYTTSSFVINPATGRVGIGISSPSTNLTVGGTAASGGASGGLGAFLSRGVTTNFYEAFDGTKSYIAGVDDTLTYAKAGTLSGHDLAIVTGNGAKIYIANSSGNVGIATTSPTAKLHVSGNAIISGNAVIGATTTTNKFEVAGSAGQLFSVSDSFTGTIFSVNDVSGIPSIEVLDTGLIKMAQYNGAVAIGTGTITSSTAELSVYGMLYTLGSQGEIRASSEITAYFSSDRRLKENIKLIENPITIIDQIRGVTFDWTDEHMARRGGEDGYFVRKHDIGVIAQEVQAVLPELVGTREDGYLAVKYEKLVPLLIEAIKEQQKTIDSLVKDLADVKEFINDLKNKNGI